jgi:hypothetical protein
MTFNDLKQDFKYRIIFADFMTTSFGPSVLVTLRENGSKKWKVYLPPRYSAIWTQEDIESILGGKTKYYLIKRGQCEETGELILGLEWLF